MILCRRVYRAYRRVVALFVVILFLLFLMFTIAGWIEFGATEVEKSKNLPIGTIEEFIQRGGIEYFLIHNKQERHDWLEEEMQMEGWLLEHGWTDKQIHDRWDQWNRFLP